MVTLFAFLLGTAHGFEVRTDEFGQALQWQRSTIRFQINPSGEHGLSEAAVDTLISAASRAWTTPVQDHLNFSHDGITTIDRANFDDGVNAIYFENEWTQDPSLLAVTYPVSYTHLTLPTICSV